MDPIPPINKFYSIVQQIESHKIISNVLNYAENASALNTVKMTGQGPWNVWKRDNKKPKTDDRWCPNCKRSGHTKETCFKLHPEQKAKFLARFSGNSGSANHVATGVNTPNPAVNSVSAPSVPPLQFDPNLFTAFYKHMAQVMQSKQDSPMDYSTASVNCAGIKLTCNALDSDFKHEWIVDSGATDHMTGLKNLFVFLTPLNKPVMIGKPDGSRIKVTHAGDNVLTVGFVLHNVLYVPTFKHSLLSVGKLLSTTSLLSEFSVDKCVLQGPTSRHPVAVGLKENGLYKLKFTDNSDSHNASVVINNVSSCSTVSSCKRNAVVDLLHARLGHTSLAKMKQISDVPCTGLTEYMSVMFVCK
ncbi:hypothetical protein RND81_12G190700 [Saponaria officinalis]|uniref:Retrovirus-related Pol polyprotein from transposon TNT 1-94-like beta-barrel domain-containing protein n=1 Tax=Saponaria officinalis TaxID=3572 RepID=A0AAW1HCP7_SAPOF